MAKSGSRAAGSRGSSRGSAGRAPVSHAHASLVRFISRADPAVRSGLIKLAQSPLAKQYHAEVVRAFNGGFGYQLGRLFEMDQGVRFVDAPEGGYFPIAMRAVREGYGARAIDQILNGHRKTVVPAIQGGYGKTTVNAIREGYGREMWAANQAGVLRIMSEAVGKGFGATVKRAYLNDYLPQFARAMRKGAGREFHAMVQKGAVARAIKIMNAGGTPAQLRTRLRNGMGAGDKIAELKRRRA